MGFHKRVNHKRVKFKNYYKKTLAQDKFGRTVLLIILAHPDFSVGSLPAPARSLDFSVGSLDFLKRKVSRS